MVLPASPIPVYVEFGAVPARPDFGYAFVTTAQAEVGVGRRVVFAGGGRALVGPRIARGRYPGPARLRHLIAQATCTQRRMPPTHDARPATLFEGRLAIAAAFELEEAIRPRDQDQAVPQAPGGLAAR